MTAFLSAILLSAFLLFQIQPIIARYILPWYGGSPTVWTACMMFFQIALLLGYLYAHVLATFLPAKRQALLHLGLLSLSLLLLPIGVPDTWTPSTAGQPALEILLLLLVSVGIPFVLISASGPLLQHWFAGVYTNKSPFRLYALSNLGSLAALLTYPVLIEPRFTIDSQATTWSLLYLVLVLVFAGCGVLYGRSQTAAIDPSVRTGAVKAVSSLDRILWISLAACGSTMLLAITNQMSTNVAVVPFMWVLPLSIYLLTFIISFDKDSWYVRGVWFPLLFVSVVMAVRLMFFEFTSESISFAYQMFVYGLALFACCMVCHGELARRRSAAPQLTTFYLYVALGGAIGGVFVNLVAPVAFTGYWELHVGLAGTVLLAGICLGIDRRLIRTSRGRAMLASAWSVALLVLIGFLVAQIQGGRTASIYVERSFFGTLYVDEWDADNVDHERQLYHGSIEHGRQIMRPALRRTPTSYYGKGSGGAAALLYHPTRQAADPESRHLNVGIIGLGAGTIAAYGIDGDLFTFYEIDPHVEQVARDYFYYLKDTAASTEVVIGDARVSMQRELEENGSREFDVLILDAFSGDAIPVHLLTEEAFALYAKHVKDDGILALHVTNEYLDLKPLVRTVARRLGKEAIWVEGSDDEWYLNDNDWVLVSGNTRFNNFELLRSSQTPWDDADFEPVLWSDDFSNLFELIDWGN